jgi:hypothetical protein
MSKGALGGLLPPWDDSSCILLSGFVLGRACLEMEASAGASGAVPGLALEGSFKICASL